jgi:hypothetical protein
MTDLELQSARQWANAIVFDGEPPPTGELTPAVISVLREHGLAPEEEFIDAMTVLLCDADSLSDHSEFVVEDFSRRQLREEVRQFALRCTNEPEDVRRTHWEQLQLRAAGDPVLLALIGQLKPLLDDVERPLGLSDDELSLLHHARMAAALPGRLGSGPKAALMSLPAYGRESIEQLTARLPESSRWIQRVIVPGSMVAGDGRQKPFMRDWLQDANTHDRSEALQQILYRVSACIILGFFALVFFTRAFDRTPPPYGEIDRGLQQYLSLPKEERLKLIRRSVDGVSASQKRQPRTPAAEPSEDRPPAPPLAVPLREPSGNQ